VFKGQYFYEWRYDRHVVKPFTIPPHWKKTMCMDWGMAAPLACYWIAIDPDKRAWVYRELYKKGMIASVAAEKVNSLTPETEKIEDFVVSRDMFAKKGEAPESIGSTFKSKITRMPIIPVKLAGTNPRISGWMRVREWLGDAPDGLPWMMIFDTCTELIRTLPEQIYDEKVVEDMNGDGEDHACFVAGTQIMTQKGFVGIETIKSGYQVLTRDGFKEVEVAEMTNSNAKVYKLETTIGLVIGTLNHPMFLKDGSKRNLGELRQGDVLFDIVPYALIQYGICRLKLYLTQFRNLKVKGIISVVNTFSAKASAFTEWFGRMLMGRSKMVFISTIRTVIEAIISWQIWKKLEVLPIFRNTLRRQKQKNSQERISHLQEKRPDCGIKTKPIAPHMSKLAEKRGGQELASRPLKCVVNFAGGSMKRITQAGLSIVMVIARPLRCAPAVKVLKLEILDIKHLVYNLRVKDKHEYIANGLLVSNCEAIRYFATMRHRKPIVEDNKYKNLPLKDQARIQREERAKRQASKDLDLDNFLNDVTL